MNISFEEQNINKHNLSLFNIIKIDTMPISDHLFFYNSSTEEPTSFDYR